MTRKTRWLTYEERDELEAEHPAHEAATAEARRLRLTLHQLEAQVAAVKARLRELRELEAQRQLRLRQSETDAHAAAQLRQARRGGE